MIMACTYKKLNNSELIYAELCFKKIHGIDSFLCCFFPFIKF